MRSSVAELCQRLGVSVSWVGSDPPQWMGPMYLYDLEIAR